jgi:hypothetical protein
MNKVNASLNFPLPLTLPVKLFTPNDIKCTFQKCPLKKPISFDLITAEIARSLPYRTLVHISHIFNAILRLSYIPIL